ncbi:MAG: DUF3810 domain-containing protein [Ruminococcus flavefaciens]|nr:DUF3810 domain-containing protein [Ruminococcus flavefaciens]MCM1229346.1 DUF3810 domain-containing protein [Ruminococcus flavefaciens]
MKKRFIIPAIITLLAVLLTVAGRLFRRFADFYADYIFPVISTPYAFLSGLLPVSLGEIMIITAVLLVIIGIPAMIICLIIKKTRAKTLEISLLTVMWIFAFIVSTESLNCFTLYGCTRFSERFFTSATHNNDELKQLYSLLIDECNELAQEVPRDENNRFTLTVDPVDECRKAMKKASEQYPQLKGYYPKPKPIMFSFFMSQTGTAGMYFPFSMESTYNGDMVDEIKPEVICHEYAHLKGFMQEDEANFISFIATSASDSAEVRYSGYLKALEYVHNQIYRNEIVSGYELTDGISQEVRNDWFRFLPENYWEDNEEKEIIPTETVDAVYNTAADTSMKLNGVEDGNASYSRMVNLLLDYYFPPK